MKYETLIVIYERGIKDLERIETVEQVLEHGCRRAVLPLAPKSFNIHELVYHNFWRLHILIGIVPTSLLVQLTTTIPHWIIACIQVVLLGSLWFIKNRYWRLLHMLYIKVLKRPDERQDYPMTIHKAFSLMVNSLQELEYNLTLEGVLGMELRKQTTERDYQARRREEVKVSKLLTPESKERELFTINKQFREASQRVRRIEKVSRRIQDRTTLVNEGQFMKDPKDLFLLMRTWKKKRKQRRRKRARKPR